MSAIECPDCGLLHVGRRTCNVPRLRKALGVDVNDRDEFMSRMIRWLAGWDEPTVMWFLGAFKRVRRAALLEAAATAEDCIGRLTADDDADVIRHVAEQLRAKAGAP